MGIEIGDLPAAAAANRLARLPVMKDGVTQFYTVGQILDLLIGAAPGQLDTLEELAAALNDDDDFAATMTAALAAKAPLESPSLTGTPTVPTAAPGTNTTQAASTAFVTAAVALVSPIFTKSFESAERTITSAGLITLDHGLGMAPKLVAPILICKTAEFGYSIGDIIPMPESLATATLNNYGASVEISGTTNILVRFGSSTNVFIYPNKTTGNAENLTNANWKLIMRAYA